MVRIDTADRQADANAILSREITGGPAMVRKVLLALLPPWSNSIVSLGIPCITPNLIRSGYEVIRKDFNIRIYPEVIEKNTGIFFNYSMITRRRQYFDEQVYPLLEPFFDEWVKEILESEADLIGFTAYNTNLYTIMNVSKLIKQKAPGKIIVLGGPEIVRNREFINWDFIDYAIAGDGEHSLPELINALRDSCTHMKHIKGIAFRNRETGEMIINEECITREMDGFPVPDFTGYNFSDYGWGNQVPIEGSRGCIHACTFCTVEVGKQQYRYKSGEKIFHDFMHFHKQGNTQFYFTDSLINGNTRELEKFCDLVIESGVNNDNSIIWQGHACIRKEMTPELLSKMKRAGCTMLHIGLESASNNVLTDMNKKITTSLARDVIKNMHEAGILVLVFVIIGFPTETEKDFDETMEFITENRKHIFEVVLGGKGCAIALGSDLHENPDKYGIYWENVESKAFNNWYSRVTTPEIRQKRAVRFIEHCNSIGIKTTAWV
jgi:anaerobic magnesium-protoporphyrin IX monomethyl ester cyclase